ncbi:NAD(P)H-dependent oxidoreductase [Vibrio sp. SS-MA-C1-2]|uniref:NAD(P)H-dependent oxidoreductase n=1 Tax=Vibrio sp. SS-MA-C1-2 TaxID=2908646 RepID=UPI001F1E3611|nr:NAD(P)H-dependent oxidoreductase [Vibrio sp. SS-MA-C1-2]UJF16822.1 NAD(P)H-dependent oxidoreductase [Vibrio sp. SS-MA-C1-2]
MNNEQILEDLRSRYTTKQYDASKKVSAEDLATLLEALRLSASSINSQPWKFVVIESDAAKERMNNTFADKFQFNQHHVFESSHIILFAHNPAYKRSDYEEVIDTDIANNRTKLENKEAAFGAFAFAELNTDENGNTAPWTKAQTYIAFGNALHTLARMKIDSTSLEGIDSEKVNAEFAAELEGYECNVALAIGYRAEDKDYNLNAPKSRLAAEKVITII